METELTTLEANTQEANTQEANTQEETTPEENRPEEEYDEFDDSIFDLIEGRANALVSAALLIVPIVIFTTAIPFTAGGSYVVMICAGFALWRANKAANAYHRFSYGRLPIRIPRRGGGDDDDDELVVQPLTPELSEFLEKHAISAREAFTHEKFNPKDMNDPNSDLYKFIYGAMLDKDGNIINKDDIDTLIAEQTKKDILDKLKNPEIQKSLTTKIKQFTHSYVSSIFNVAKIIAAKKLGKGGKTRRRPKRKRSKSKRNQKKSNKRRA
jgi:hypothetical protein